MKEFKYCPNKKCIYCHYEDIHPFLEREAFDIEVPDNIICLSPIECIYKTKPLTVECKERYEPLMFLIKHLDKTVLSAEYGTEMYNKILNLKDSESILTGWCNLYKIERAGDKLNIFHSCERTLSGEWIYTYKFSLPFEPKTRLEWNKK